MLPSTVLDISFKTSSGLPPILTAINDVVCSVIPNRFNDSAICGSDVMDQSKCSRKLNGR